MPYNVIAQSSPYLSAHASSIAFDTIKGFLNHTTIIFKNIHPAFLHTKKSRINPTFNWRPQGDSNPRYRRERAMS